MTSLFANKTPPITEVIYMRNCHEYHIFTPEHIELSREAIKRNRETLNEIINDLENGWEPRKINSCTSLIRRLDESRNSVIEWEKDFNADAMGYCIQSPWEDEEYIRRIESGEGISGMKL